jgi:hypothetical protein
MGFLTPIVFLPRFLTPIVFLPIGKITMYRCKPIGVIVTPIVHPPL